MRPIPILMLALLALALVVVLSWLAPMGKQLPEQIPPAPLARLVDDLDAPRLGNPQGDTILIAFSDYNCGYCRKNHAEIRALLRADPRLQLVVHELAILGEGSHFAARAALAADRQGRYAEFHAALMALSGSADQDSVLRVARQLGLDLPRLTQDMDSPEIAAQIAKSKQIALEIGLPGTPSWVIGGRTVLGFRTAKELTWLVTLSRK